VASAPTSTAWRIVVVVAAALLFTACQQVSRTSPSASTATGQATTATELPSSEIPRRIGVLVPLSGRAGEVGQDLARAVEMALLERGDAGIELVPRDTESTADGALLAARELLEVHQVDVILGPLFGSSAERVAGLARGHGVAVLAFSNQSEIAGDGLFVLGYRPEEQVERVVDFAVGRGFSRVAALAPDDAYGRRAVASVRDAAQRSLGATLIGTEFYGSDAINAGARIDALRGEVGPNELPPFDALLIADGGNRLRQVAQLLPRHDVDPVDVRMLGTRLWADSPAVLREPALRGGWFAAVPETAQQSFNRRFRQIFGRDPHPLAILAYDGFLVAEDAALDAETSIGRITETRGYQGEAGILRLLPSGVAQHGLAIYELTAAGPVVVDPAPTRFDDRPS